MPYSVIELSGDAEEHTQTINAAAAEGFKLIAVNGDFAYFEEMQ